MRRSILILVTIISAFVISSKSSFLTDVTSSKGLDIGNGFNLKLTDSKKAAPILQRINLDLSYGNVGVSARKARRLDDVSLDFYVKDKNAVFEGRGRGNKGGGDNRIGMLIGFKTALIVAFIFIIMKLLVIKAIILAKVSLIISLVLLVLKLKNKDKPELLEIEQHGPYAYSHPGLYSEKHPGYGGYSNAGQDGGIEAAASDNSYNVVYAPTSVAENAALYANAPVGNHTVLQPAYANQRKYDTADRRREKMPSTFFTIKKILGT